MGAIGRKNPQPISPESAVRITLDELKHISDLTIYLLELISLEGQSS